MQSKSNKVAIIGGGCAGIAAATDLIINKIPVTLYDRNDFLGGLASGFKETSWNSSLEFFYHHWFKSDAVLSHYIKLWKLEDKLIFKRPITVSQTKTHGYVQLDSPLSLLAYPELPFFDKIRMGAALAYLKMVRDWQPLERKTAKEWCEKYMGKQGFDAIWRPLLEGKFGTKYANIVNMAWFWARIRCRTAELGTYQGGFQKLFDDIEQWLQTQGVVIQKNCGSLLIEREIEGWRINGETFSHLVVATEPKSFSEMCGKFAPNYTSRLTKRPALGVQVVILSAKQALGDYYWYSLRKSTANPFLALIEHTNFVPKSEFGDEHIIYLADYVDIHSPEGLRSNEELLELAIRTCAGINPKFDKSLINRSWVFRNSYAQPVVGINASKEIPLIKIDEAPHLFHLSMAHVYPWDRGTNFAFDLGHKAALLILKEMRHASNTP